MYIKQIGVNPKPYQEKVSDVDIVQIIGAALYNTACNITHIVMSIYQFNWKTITLY